MRQGIPGEVRNMAFSARKVEQEQYVRIECEGRVTIREIEEGRAALKVALDKAAGYDKVLVDMRKASLGVSGIDIQQFAPARGGKPPSGVCIAVLVQLEDWDNAVFAQTVARNHGICMRVFLDDVYARSWLKNSDRT